MNDILDFIRSAAPWVAMTLIGFSTLIRMEEGYTRCPEFWDVEYSRKYACL